MNTSIKDIINKDENYLQGDFIFTGRKSTQIIAMDPFTGKTVHVYGNDMTPTPNHINVDLDRHLLYIGRTGITLNWILIILTLIRICSWYL